MKYFINWHDVPKEPQINHEATTRFYPKRILSRVQG